MTRSRPRARVAARLRGMRRRAAEVIAAAREVPDEGAGTVLALAILGVVAFVGLAVAGLGAATSARAVAQSAADLAALAAADTLALGAVVDDLGATSACDRAVQVAERHGATLEACEPEPGAVVVVRVSRATPFGPAWAAARAGPATARS